MAMALLFSGLVASTYAYTGLEVQASDSPSSCPTGYDSFDCLGESNCDFNQAALGKYIYLCTKSISGASQITGLKVVKSDTSESGCGTLTSPWTRITEMGDSNGDFNQGSKGKYVYLCQESLGGSPAITSLKVQSSSSASSCPTGYTMVPGTNGNADLNEGHGGKYVYLCYQTAYSTGLAAERAVPSQLAFGVVAFVAGAVITFAAKMYKTRVSKYSPLLDSEEVA